ncbi:MAG: heme peroxidase family protein [Paracoccaceae bacterium]
MTQHHGMKELDGMAAHCKAGHEPQQEDRFGRMFHLPPSYVPADVLKAVGKAGGPMDDKGKPKRTKTVPVGHVFFGQFVDHDITLDVSSSFSRVNDPSQIENVRTPTLDLDCVYGSGPEAHPFLYDQAPGPMAGVRLLTGADQKGAGVHKHDLLRNPQGTAIIGDPRNHENRIVSQILLGMINFHNHVAETLRTDAAQEKPKRDLKGHDLFVEARRITTWHYQWGVVNDFLVDMCGEAVVKDILASGRQFYCPLVPHIPIEFAVAAYRFGHSMAPMHIQVQSKAKSHELFSKELGNGFSPLPSKDAVVDMREIFFVPKKSGTQLAETLDTLMATELLALPFITSGENSLATRNLLRGNSFLLPGGDKIAEKMGRPADEIAKVMKKIAHLSKDEITEGAPLWLYLLAEGEVIGRETEPGKFDKGEGLGPVGARIVAEVLIGLLELDEHSYLGANRNWTPETSWNTVGKMLHAVNSSLFD